MKIITIFKIFKQLKIHQIQKTLNNVIFKFIFGFWTLDVYI